MSVLPAYAGMILREEDRSVERTGAPRVCGDDPAKAVAIKAIGTVLPAYAGMILLDDLGGNEKWGAPRVCGDDPGYARAQTTGTVCSPRMRG